MSNSKIPYNNTQLLKWSCFRIEKSTDYKKPYELVHTPLTELVKKNGYEHFKDKLNWLYNNYNVENYQLIWTELQEYNEKRKISFIQDNLIARADYLLEKEIKHWKDHFGTFEPWVEKLNDKQRDLLLARARTCYGLEPEEVVLETKQVYTIPTRIVKELNDFGDPIYYSQEELNKANVNNNYYQDVVGRVKMRVAEVQRYAENFVIQTASYFAKFNNTEYDLRECREVEGDEFKNQMVPIADLQGPDSPYGIEVELRDFLEPIYECEEEEGVLV